MILGHNKRRLISLSSDEMMRSLQDNVVTDPLALRKRLQTIVEVEIPQFVANIRPTRLPIVDMTEAFARAANASNSISTDLSRSSVEGLRKFWGDLTREIKALEKVLVP